MSNDNVISLNGKTADAPVETPRIPNVFEFFNGEGPIMKATGYLNLAPDFAAVIDDNNDVVFVVQSSGYTYVKNLGPAQATA